MKITITSGIFPPDIGGPASYVPKMALELSARGHEVSVLCMSDEVKNKTAYPFEVKRIRRSMFKPVRSILLVCSIWRMCRKSHLVYINGLSFEAFLAALIARKPAIHKIVGDYAWERARNREWFQGTIDEYQRVEKGFLLRILDRIRTTPLRFAKTIVVPSRYLAGLVKDWGVEERKIAVVYNAAEESSLPIEINLPAFDGHTLVTVCRLVPWKGVDALIRIVSRNKILRLLIIGDGPLRGELNDLAERLGAHERILFLGNVGKSDVAGYLLHADIFILNSSYEGLPHVVLEAMEANLPVIATDAGGTREVVEHLVTGLLIPVGDEVALENSVSALINDQAMGLGLIANARKRLALDFAYNVMVEKTEACLAAHGRVGAAK